MAAQMDLRKISRKINVFIGAVTKIFFFKSQELRI
jgi:hypothetical protein